MTRKPLGPRQTEVIQHVAQGLSVDESAALLHLSRWTVKTHRSAVIRCLGARNIAHAVAIYLTEHAEEQVRRDARDELLRAINDTRTDGTAPAPSRIAELTANSVPSYDRRFYLPNHEAERLIRSTRGGEA